MRAISVSKYVFTFVSCPEYVRNTYQRLFKVLHTPASVQSFEKAGERAEALAFAEILKQKKRELFEKLKRESYVEVLQKDPPASLLQSMGAAVAPQPEKDQFVPPEK